MKTTEEANDEGKANVTQSASAAAGQINGLEKSNVGSKVECMEGGMEGSDADKADDAGGSI